MVIAWRAASLRVPLGRLVVEVADRHAPAAAARALLPLAVLLGDGADAEAEERLHVVRHLAVARGDEDLADLFGEARLGLDDRAGRRRAPPRLARSSSARLSVAGHVERELVELVAARQRRARGA